MLDFFYKFFNNFSSFLLCKINVLSIFHITLKNFMCNRTNSFIVIASNFCSKKVFSKSWEIYEKI